MGTLKDQLAATRVELTGLRRILNQRAPGRTRNGETAWQVIADLTDWLNDLEIMAWPLPGRGMQEGIIGRTGHTDPTSEAASRRFHKWTADGEQARLLETIANAIDRSKTNTLGDGAKARRHNRPPSTARPTCDACPQDHAATWTVCPWTGRQLRQPTPPNRVVRNEHA